MWRLKLSLNHLLANSADQDEGPGRGGGGAFGGSDQISDGSAPNGEPAATVETAACANIRFPAEFPPFSRRGDMASPTIPETAARSAIARTVCLNWRRAGAPVICHAQAVSDECSK
jgi:hypothetical protein